MNVQLTLAKTLINLHALHYRSFTDEQLRDEHMITLARKAELLRRDGTGPVIALADVLLDAVNLERERRKEQERREPSVDTLGLESMEAYRVYLTLLQLADFPNEQQRVEDLRKRAHGMGDGLRVAECVERTRAITDEVLARHQAA